MNEKVNKILTIVFNGASQFEYDRNKKLPDHQLEYLKSMDAKMDNPIQLNGEEIQFPNIEQKALFVSSNLAQAIMNNEEAVIAALMSYLAIYRPDLQQVIISQNNTDISIELVYDKKFVNEQLVKFYH